MGMPNWSKLYNEGRCKAIGIPFSDDELQAIKNGASVEDVRAGNVKIESVKIIPNKIPNTDEEVKKSQAKLQESKTVVGDEKELKKQIKVVLREKGIPYSNFETLETLQAKLK